MKDEAFALLRAALGNKQIPRSNGTVLRLKELIYAHSNFVTGIHYFRDSITKAMVVLNSGQVLIPGGAL